MYLTEIKLYDADAARIFPANPYDWHKVVWSFFPNKSERDFLYRVDYTSRGVRLMLLSQTEPVSPLKNDCHSYKCREIPISFFSHSLYRFQVRVNPTKRIKKDARTGTIVEKGMRVPITDEYELKQWLKRKGESFGFSLSDLQDVSILFESRLNFQKKGYRKAHHYSVQFSGVLRVENADLFRNSFIQGIGSAKSFGFGLLMLQPLNYNN